MKKLIPHDFIARSQNKFFTNLKNQLRPGEFVEVDFAENYTFVMQNVAQVFHWNNDQATLFPIVFYYQKNDSLIHCSLIVITDCRKNDLVSVYIMSKELIIFKKQIQNK